MALEEKLRSIGVFENLSFLAGLKIGRVVEILEQISILSATVFVQKDGPIRSASIVHETRMDQDAKDIGRLGIADPFMINRISDIGEFDRLAIDAVQNLKSAGNSKFKLKIPATGLTSYRHTGIGRLLVTRPVVKSLTPRSALTVLSAAM